MKSFVLVILISEIWSGCAQIYREQPSNRWRRQTYPLYRYNSPNINWNDTIYFPEDTRDIFNSQSFSNYRHDPKYADLFSKSILTLAHKIGATLENFGSSKTQIFSPVSIASALTLLLLGSKGSTHEELIKLFNFDLDPLYTSRPDKIHEEFALMIEDLLEHNIQPSRARPQPPWKYMHRNEFALFRNEAPKKAFNPDDHIIRVANGIFVQDGFSLRPDYKTVVQQLYKSQITSLDFQRNPTQAKNYINSWVREKTRNKIPTIVSDQISPDTLVILANALYFKALWEKEFLEGGTITTNFYPDGRDSPSIKVQMMSNGGVFPFYDAKEYGCRIIGLPYRNNLSTMYIIMPNESTRLKLRNLQYQLNADTIEYMISRMTQKTAIIALPRLHIQNSIYLKQVLSDLGVKTIFHKGLSDLSLISSPPCENVQSKVYQQVRPLATEAPLIFTRIDNNNCNQYSTNRTKRAVTYKVESSNPETSEPLRLKDFILNKRITKLNPGKKRSRRQIMNPFDSIKALEELRKTPGLIDPQLFVDEIVHKVDLVVNEKGTEGGAATIAYLRRSGPEVIFRVDTPFMILVRHDPTKLPLFYGTVYEPVDF